MVAAAHGLGKRTAAILTARQFATSVSVRALTLTIRTDDVLEFHGWGLVCRWNDFVSVTASVTRKAAGVALWTATEEVVAAHGIRVRAAAVITTGYQAAGLSIWTFARKIRTDYVLQFGWSFNQQWNNLVFLSACASRNVTRVAIRTAVEMVAAAHGLGKRTAAILTARQFAAGVSIRALTLAIRTDDVLQFGWSLLHKRNDIVSFSACTGRNVTRVAIRTAVEMVAAAHGLGKRTAAILTARQFATSVSIRALTLTIRTDDVLQFGWSLLHKWNDIVSFSACASRNVTRVAIRTAVEMVAAAHGLGKRTAAILTARQFAAGVSVRALTLTIRTDYVLQFGWSLLHKWNDIVSFSACASRNVTRVAIRTAVEMVAAAHGLGKRTAAILTARQFAAGVSIRALTLTIRTDYVLQFGWSLLHKRNHLISFSASTSGNVTRVAIGTAVEMVTAAHGLGKRTAAILTARQFAASVSIRALTLTIRTDYVLQFGRSLLHKRNDIVSFSACTSRNVTRVAIRTAVEMVAAAHGLGKRTAAILTARQFAASVSIRALTLTIRTDDVLQFGRSLLHKWNDIVSFSACTSGNVTRVAIRTAVEMVAAAHGLGKRTAAILTTCQFAASVSIRALTLTIRTDDVLQFGQSLLHKWNHLISFSACTGRNVTCVAIRTAVEMVAAAHGLGKRTAAILTAHQFATSVSIRALTLTIRTDDVLQFGWSLLHKRNDIVSFSACTGRNVTRVAIRTAVEMVAAAHGLGKRTAAILTARQFATSVSIRALTLTIRADDVLQFGWSLLHKRNDIVSFSACTGRNVTRVAIRTAVEMVAAAHGLGKRTAAILTARQFAAGVSIRALTLTIRTDDVLQFGRSLLHKRNHLIFFSACTSGNVTRVAIRTAVEMVAAAHGLGKRTAAILTTRQFAAGVSIRALTLTIRTDDVLQFGRSLLHKWNHLVSFSACASRNVTRVAIRTAVEMVTAAHGLGKRTAAILTARQFAAGVSVRALTLTIRTDYVPEVK